MSSVTKAGLIVLAVGVGLTVVIFVAASVFTPPDTGANIGAGIGMLVSIPVALIGAVIAVVGFILERVTTARKPSG
ncbi:MAG: hypothetical protein L0J68_12450 [Micrococcaceae bacterium]|uniref:hypothetical protein n=1 Tax=unclassified Arthrobacter TaxID=235627 RepID=UPI0026542531|nr:hypothetical protein [Micrococcaceae bacterium]MDN6168833.1 hypothetical protein [Micrococcaceae bacterium]MDN6178237.1 hypothetical protein [Micrococcaceae bacterium]MDN6301059.1 hypothetical protein [Micrococcaceae bacterium]